MTLTQIIYASTPFGFDQSILSNLLLDARRFNKRDGITGALVCRRDIYLQLLEGPDAAVRATYRRILGDDRHVDIRELSVSTVPARQFGDWDMFHDPAASWLWTQDEIAAGALDRATPEQARNVFTRLADRIAAGGTGQI